MKANLTAAGLVGAFLLAGCAAKTPPPPPPRIVTNPALPQPARPTALVTPPDWRDRTVMAGDWSWSRIGNQSVAVFALPNGAERLRFTCDPARRTVAIRFAQVEAAQSSMTITTTSVARTLQARGTAGPPPSVTAEVPAADRLLDAIVFSRGRFMVQTPGGSAIAPSWPEIARVIEDCR